MAVLDTSIQAIETRYKGYRFRSRLEARWAVFFETLGVEFNYEKEGYRLGTIDYLPDFYLPSIPAFFEVKGRELTQEDELKCSQLAIRSGYPVYVWVGDIPEPSYDWGNGFLENNDCMNLLAYFRDCQDVQHRFNKCSICGKFGIYFRDDVCLCHCGKGMSYEEHAMSIWLKDIHLLAAAYAAARSARFEHGERG